MSSMHKCQNPTCGTSYNADNSTDDGFCSFDCWETVNCGTPQVAHDIEAVKELTNFRL